MPSPYLPRVSHQSLTPLSRPNHTCYACTYLLVASSSVAACIACIASTPDELSAGAGVNLQIRAAKTEADTSTWTGSNPICTQVNLTTSNLGKLVKCSQPMLARDLTVIDMDGESLPICSLDAVISMPQPGPDQAVSPSAESPGM